jgi:hypothetical protein
MSVVISTTSSLWRSRWFFFSMTRRLVQSGTRESVTITCILFLTFGFCLVSPHCSGMCFFCREQLKGFAGFALYNNHGNIASPAPLTQPIADMLSLLFEVHQDRSLVLFLANTHVGTCCSWIPVSSQFQICVGLSFKFSLATISQNSLK